MATPSPVEQIASDISSLQTKIGWMQDSARLKNALDSIEDLQTSVNGMQQRIAGLRTKGYVFEKDLETQAADFVRQWSQLHPSLVTQVNLQSASLQGSLRSIEMRMTQLNNLRTNPSAARPLITSIRSEMDLLEDKVRSAENTVNGMYDSFNSQVSAVKWRLEQIEYLLTQLAEAKFGLLPTEGGIMAVKAVWCKDVKERDDDPDGVLYLTDQRLLFEQKEEIATKKILFITTEKQKVQELKWEVPVALVEEIKPSKQGLLKNEDHLDLRFGGGAALQSVHLHIWQEGNEWLQLLNRAKTKDFDKGRAVAIDQGEVEKVRSIPAQCPSCGGNIDQVILRGQDSVKCEYCGFVIRL
jgi:predicted  nucleic acid-binding Zn-ribbon protein